MINFVMLGLPLLCGAMASPSLAQKAEKVEVVNQVQPKLVSYNDNGYSITLSVDELNNYTFENLSSLLTEKVSDIDFNNALRTQSNLTLNSVIFDFDDISVSDITYLNNDSSYYIYFNGTTTSKFEYANANDEVLPFEYDLTWILDVGIYDDIKTAIQQDIVDNTASMPTIADLFTPITQAITSFVGALGQAFSSVTALFWTTGENAGPTFLGLLVLIGVGVGLIYGAYRIIKGLMHRI